MKDEKLVNGSFLPSAFCLLPSAFCLLPFAFCLLPSAFNSAFLISGDRLYLTWQGNAVLPHENSEAALR